MSSSSLAFITDRFVSIKHWYLHDLSPLAQVSVAVIVLADLLVRYGFPSQIYYPHFQLSIKFGPIGKYRRLYRWLFGRRGGVDPANKKNRKKLH
jgi:hypothetical protein